VDVKKTLISDTSISQVLKLASRANIALIGIGSPLAPNSTIRQTGYYTDRELNDLRNAKTACDLCWIFIDAEGKLCPLELNQRVIGISIDDLKVIPTVVGVAGGSEKHEAILATLKGHYIDVLVTDEKTANFLLGSIGG
jgi:DNA-binding transcriptional regulator LsrR (DeoR family)